LSTDKPSPRRQRGRPDRPLGAGRPRSLPGRRYWLYGAHAGLAALANPARVVHRILATQELAGAHAARLAALPDTRRALLETVDRHAIDRLLPPGAVHQGLAIDVAPLEPADVSDLVVRAASLPRAAVIALDKVSDPRNAGAILRSAAAFGAIGVVVPDRGSPEESGALAKAASGALEAVPLVRVVNLRRALEALKEGGFWCAGFAGDAADALDRTALPERVALALGAEGEGLRPLTRATCDLLVRIPIADGTESLNVSNAAAVALYEWSRRARL
jgi:23S rRNA (guanosine2251-2'-O)-methyltransferase